MTTALLGLFTLLGISGCGAKQSNSQQTMNEDDGYTFVATLFCSTDGPNSSPAHYYLKNPDGTLYLDIHNEENDLSRDPLLDGKIFVYYWNGLSYAFFCKRPEAGKPIEVRVGDEWKTLESSAHIQIDSTGKFLQQYYTYVPRGEEGERLPLDFYPSPKADPAKKDHPHTRQFRERILHPRCRGRMDEDTGYRLQCTPRQRRGHRRGRVGEGL